MKSTGATRTKVRRPSSRTTARAAPPPAPYQALAERGAFHGFIELPGRPPGLDAVYATVRPGDNAATARPILLLDGQRANHPRTELFGIPLHERLRRTIIAPYLPGQGQTFLREMERTGGRWKHDAISLDGQVDAIAQTLDALGVTAPVHIVSLSYGAQLAAAFRRKYPERVDQTFLTAPLALTAARRTPWNDAMYRMMQATPFGDMMLTQFTLGALRAHYEAPPPMAATHHDAYFEALTALMRGSEDFRLADEVRGLTGIHALLIEGDVVTPPKDAEVAMRGVKEGTVTYARPTDERDPGKRHDVWRRDADHVIDWLLEHIRRAESSHASTGTSHTSG